MQAPRLARQLAVGMAVLGVALIPFLSVSQPSSAAVELTATPGPPFAGSYRIYLPVVAQAAPTSSPPAASGGFLGANGTSLDSATPADGSLAYNTALRDKSFDWMARAGLNWYRNYGSDSIALSWRMVQPAPGTYDWLAWDNLVRATQRDNIDLSASIGNGVPEWSNGTTDWRMPPLDLYASPLSSTSWYQYVRAIVERYDGDADGDMPGLTRPIKYWELWNEPDLLQGWNLPAHPPHQFNGDVHQYVQLSRVGYAAVKDADPSAFVVGPSSAQYAGNTYVGEWFLWNWPQFMSAGGLNYVDIVSSNHYFDNHTFDSSGRIDWLLNEIDKNRGGKPSWLTEIGWEGNASTDSLTKARNYVRSAVIIWSRPFMTKYFWYAFHDRGASPATNSKAMLQTTTGPASRGIEPDPLFHPTYLAAQVMARVLAGFDAGDHPSTVNVGSAARAYRFSDNSTDVWVTWTRAVSGTSTISLNTGGRSVRMIGMWGEDLGTFAGGALTVGPLPIYLTTNLDWNPDLGQITGRIRDGAQPGVPSNGLEGATVAISGPVTGTTTTDRDGNYLFENLPADTYVVSLPGSAATPSSRTVIVAPGTYWGQTSFSVP